MLVVLVLLDVVFLITHTASFSLRIQPEYKYGEVIDVYFLHEERFSRSTFTIRIHAGEELLWKCTIPPDKSSLIFEEDFPENPTGSEELYHLVQIHSTFVQSSLWDDKRRLSLNFTVESDDPPFEASVFTDLTAPREGWDGVKAEVLMYDRSQLYGKAARVLTDTLVVYHRSSPVEFKIDSPLLGNVSWSHRVELHRINQPDADWCPIANLIGQIDLDEFISLNSLEPCEVDMRADSYSFGPFMIPHGYVRISLLVEENSRLLYTYYFYFHVSNTNALPFHEHSSPWVEYLYYPEQQDIYLDTTGSFFPFLQPYYGYITDGNLTVTATCLGTSYFCLHGQIIGMSNAQSFSVPNYLFGGERNIIFKITYSFADAETSQIAAIRKFFLFNSNALHMAIVCVRNCKQYFAPYVPAVFVAKCYTCLEKELSSIQYSWDFPYTNNTESTTMKYLIIYPPLSTSHSFVNISVQICVTNQYGTKYKGDARKPYAVVPKAMLRDLLGEAYLSESRNVYATYFINASVYSSIQEKAAPLRFCFLRPSKGTHAIVDSVVCMPTFLQCLKKAFSHLEVCTFSSFIPRFALYNVETVEPPSGQLVVYSADGFSIHKKLTLMSKDVRYLDVLFKSLAEKCRKAIDYHVFGLSNIVALAQDLFRDQVSSADLEECYEIVKDEFLTPNLRKSRYKDAFRILYMFLMHPNRHHTYETITEALDNLVRLRELIFQHYLLKTEELEQLTRWTLEAIDWALENLSPLDASKLLLLEEDFHNKFWNTSMALLRLHETMGHRLTFEFDRRCAFMLWADLTNETYTFPECRSGNLTSSIMIPRQVYLDTFSFYHARKADLVEEDTFANIMVLLSDKVRYKHLQEALNYGTVELHTEVKSTGRELKLVHINAPIQIFFTKRVEEEVQNMEFKVIEENGMVVDSSCIIFAITRSSRVNITVDLTLSGGNYGYSFAAVEAEHPSESLKFQDALFTNISGRHTFDIPKVSTLYKYTNPLSRIFFMIRARTEGESGIGFNQGRDFWQERDPGDAQSGQNRTVTSGMLSVKAQISKCYYFLNGRWRNDGGCQSKQASTSDTVICQCYVDALYSASRSSALDHLIEFKPTELEYIGPSLVPALFASVCCMLLVFYCYWAYFQDQRERDCAQTHVPENMYKPDSPDQYLVCISTGAMPGSGTNKRIGFILVGETGSFKLNMPEGRFCFSTGSDIWFLLSSDVELGPITGVTVNYDKITNGSDLYPWFLRRVIVYSQRQNQVMVYHANRTLGVHLPSLVLPTMPQEREWTKEVALRFWRIVKVYHLLGSVLLHVPGKGATKCQSMIASVSIILATSALAIEILGPPTPVYHEKVLKTRSTEDYLDAILRLSALTLCMSLMVKLLFTLLFRKEIGVIWYNKPQPVEGFWQGGRSAPAWDRLIVHMIQPDKAVQETWLTNKQPLLYEPEARPEGLLHTMYFPHRALTREEKKQLKSIRPQSTVRDAIQVEPTKSCSRALRKAMIAHIGRGRAVSRMSVASNVSKESKFSKTSKASSTGASYASHTLGWSDMESFIVKSRESSAGSTRDIAQSAVTSNTENSKETTTRFLHPSMFQQHTLRRSVTRLDHNRNHSDPTSPVTSGYRYQRCYVQASHDREVGDMDSIESAAQSRQQPSELGENATSLSNQTSASSRSSRRRSKLVPLSSMHQSESMAGCCGGESKTSTNHRSALFDRSMGHGIREDAINTGAINRHLKLTSREKQSLVRQTWYLTRYAGKEDTKNQSTICFQRSQRHPQTSRPGKSCGRSCPLHSQKTSAQLKVLPRAEAKCHHSMPSRNFLAHMKDNKESNSNADGIVKFVSTKKRPFIPFYPNPQCDHSEHPQAITCFHKHYFNSVGVKGFTHVGQWHAETRRRGTNFKFLRNARYLEKMAKDHSICDFVIPEQEFQCSHFVLKENKNRPCGIATDVEKSRLNDVNTLEVHQARTDDLCAISQNTRPKTSSSFVPSDISNSIEVIKSSGELLGSSSIKSLYWPCNSRCGRSESEDVSLCSTSSLAHSSPGGHDLVAMQCCSQGGELERNKQHLAQSHHFSITCPRNKCRGCSGPKEDHCRALHNQRCMQEREPTSPNTIPKITLISSTPALKSRHKTVKGIKSFRMSWCKRMKTQGMSKSSHLSKSASPDVRDASNTCAPAACSRCESDKNFSAVRVGDSLSEIEKELPPLSTRNLLLTAVDPPHVDVSSSPVDAVASKHEEIKRSIEPFMNYWTKKEPQKSTSGLVTSQTTLDYVMAFWAVKVYFLRIPALIIAVSIIIFCSGWITYNGLFYSLQQGLDWLAVLVVVLLLETVLLEPVVFLCCAVVSTQLWQTPLIINECLKRFQCVMEEVNYRDWLVELFVTGRPMTSFTHWQATSESAALFHLHNKIYKALKKLVRLPDVVFESGVYWLIVHTISILVFVNLQTDTRDGYLQNAYIKEALGVQESQRPLSVVQLWDFVSEKLHPGLILMESKINWTFETRKTLQGGKIEESPHPREDKPEHNLGSMLISPVRFKQIRTMPSPNLLAGKDQVCLPLNYITIDKKRQCNYEFNIDTMETRNFGLDWKHLQNKGYQDHYTFSPGREDFLSNFHSLPQSGYQAVVSFHDEQSYRSLSELNDSDWIDQHTRYLFIDFSLLNLDSHIASSFRITFHFRGPAPFWQASGFHFYYEMVGSQFYSMVFLCSCFLIITASDVVKELFLMYKSGPLSYLSRYSSYIEMTKVVLSTLLCYVFFRKRNLSMLLLHELKHSYTVTDHQQSFVDFFEVAELDYIFKVTCAFLAFLCIFQLFLMLSKIRRLLLFINLLKSSVALFMLPVVTGITFACLSFLLFGPTTKSFATKSTSFLMMFQYFIKPPAIYNTVTENHPYLGPIFLLMLGFSVNFFVLNFFIVFINEAFSSVCNKVRIVHYKVREKSHLEYVYAFLGIESTIKWEVTNFELQQDSERDRDHLIDMKRLLVD